MAKGDIIKDGYEIIQSVEIGGLEIVVAENLAADQPYMTWRRSLDQPFGAESHILPVLDMDYNKILREFVHCQSACVDVLELDRVYRGSAWVDRPLSEYECVPGSMDGDLKGKVVAIRPDALSPEYRARSHQLTYVTGGFGCSPNTRGRTVFGTNIYSGKEERWDRAEILGVVPNILLPGWAHDKLAKLHEPQEKESVMAKIRGAKEAAKVKPRAERTSKPHSRSGPEI